jgi:hypothetical protein
MPNDSVGDPRKSHPLPLRIRSCLISREMGGSLGYRGKEFYKARQRCLWLAGYRSVATGLQGDQSQLEVDHIIPYRIGGMTPRTNDQINLRVLDMRNNRFKDYAEGFQEKPVVRRLRAF